MPAVASFPSSPALVDQIARSRIFCPTRADFFICGYGAVTMNDRATELGISRKTRYLHSIGADAILREVSLPFGDEIKANADALLGNRSLNFTGKLRGFAEGMVQRLQSFTPHSLRDLQRYAPALNELAAAMRQKSIPYVFGRFAAERPSFRRVRTHLNAAFAIEFYLQAGRGLVPAATLHRPGRAPREARVRTIELFFGGLITTRRPQRT